MKYCAKFPLLFSSLWALLLWGMLCAVWEAPSAQAAPPLADVPTASAVPSPLDEVIVPGASGVNPESADKAATSPWRELEPGLEYAEFERDDQSASTVVVLRFHPSRFVFSLHTVSERGLPLRTLRQWAEENDLVAAINASMYLPDSSTSTGYMRNGEHINNKRVAGRFGAFFVAEPDDVGLPSAALLDKDNEGWEAMLAHYKVVVQNYRMINAKRSILWSPGGPLYSISAVGQDGKGNILFIHCREPIEAYSFASLLLHLPLDVRTVMYVEGGAQAGLALRTQGYSLAWGGRHPADFLVTGNVNAALPNVLGVTGLPHLNGWQKSELGQSSN